MDSNDSLESGELIPSEESLEEGEIIDDTEISIEEGEIVDDSSSDSTNTTVKTVKSRLSTLNDIEIGSTPFGLSFSLPIPMRYENILEIPLATTSNTNTMGYAIVTNTPEPMDIDENISEADTEIIVEPYSDSDNIITISDTDSEKPKEKPMEVEEKHLSVSVFRDEANIETQNTQDTQQNTLGFDTQPPPYMRKPKNTHIKKRFLSRAATYSIKPTTIPIMICDLTKIETVDKFLHCFSNIYFDYVLLYGKVFLLKMKDEYKKCTYRLDDGTGTVKIHYEHHSPKYKAAQKNLAFLNSSTAAIKKTKPDLAKALETLNKATEQKYKETEQKFELNSKVLVYGRPFYSKYDNEIHISVENVHLDQGEDRSFEIEFKEWMNETYMDVFGPNGTKGR